MKPSPLALRNGWLFSNMLLKHASSYTFGCSFRHVLYFALCSVPCTLTCKHSDSLASVWVWAKGALSQVGAEGKIGPTGSLLA